MEGSTATRKLTATTMAEAFRDTVDRVPDRVAFRTKDDSVSLTWGRLRDRVDALAGGLDKLGVKRGDTVALMFGNRPEFHLADLAAMTLGATPFSIYQTYTPDQIQYIVSDAGAKVAIIEEQFRETFVEARQGLPDLEHLIVVDGKGGDGTLTLEEVEVSHPEFDADAAWRAVEPDDILTLIYTSGTTGPPKGVELTHKNLLAAIGTIEEIIEFPDNAKVISWLPSAHVAERNAHHYIPIAFGGQVTTCDNPREILSYLPEVRPTWFFAVPRIWEKLKAGLETTLASQPPEQREKMEAALTAAREKVRLEQAREPVPEELAATVEKADEEMFSGLRKMLGLDEVIAINVGAAPTPPEVLEFFHAIGLELAELWGMSETCGAGTCNRPGEVKLGTVGPAAPGIEIKLAEDGEVLVRGDVVMQGYRNQPDKTAETIDSDGWLATGDIGEIDDEGFLKIVDRKKELIINAAGKNMSPANIEAKLKASSGLIAQAVAIGDARPYNVALIALDPESLAARGASADDPAIAAEIAQAVETANARLSRVEQIKRYEIVAGEWLPGGDELTPTMKLKRRPIERKYESEIDALYS
jgi:long-subunit acyl-CoA synthetase (AMP-forming)